MKQSRRRVLVCQGKLDLPLINVRIHISKPDKPGKFLKKHTGLLPTQYERYLRHDGQEIYFTRNTQAFCV